MSKVTVIILFVVILGGYLYFSKPDSLVIDEYGKCDGIVNKGRALIQRDKFWKLQLILANEVYSKCLAPQIPSSSEMQKLYHALAEDEKALNEKMKPLYTPEEQMALVYRMKADSIERTGKWRIIDKAAVEEKTRETEKVKIIIQIIEAKLKIPKSQDPIPTDSKPPDKPAL